ncbi:MAG TPA: hypothetical protein VFA05_04330 [Gaiellaceae bacterium]|nr:hypothetical protein [Gaiellaceae bacterium]
MSTPDVTPAQLLAVAKFAITFAVAQHYLPAGQSRLLLQVAGFVIPAAIVLADALIRHGRTKIGLEVLAQQYQRELRAEQNAAAAHAAALSAAQRQGQV